MGLSKDGYCILYFIIINALICKLENFSQPNWKNLGWNISSVGLESECPGIGKIEGELFIPRENFSFSEIVVKVSCQTERSEVWQA